MDSAPGRNFRLLWLGRSLSVFGDNVVPAALALAVVRATGSAGALAFVLGCATVPRLILLPLGGVLADRWEPRRVALVADWVRALTQLIVGIELISGTFRLVDLAVAGVVTGAASAFALPTRSALIAATSAVDQRVRANALLSVSDSAARVLGPAAAGALVLGVGSGWAFALDAVTFVVSALALTGLRIPPIPVAVRPPIHRDLIEGWSELRRHDWFWTSLIAHACWNLAAAVLLTLGPLLAVRRPGGEAVWVATVQAGAFGLLAGALLATRLGRSGRLRLRIDRPILVANLALSTYAVPLVLFAAGAPVPALLAGYGLALAALGFLTPVWDTAVQRHIPVQRLSRVSAYDSLVSFGAMPIGYALAAPAAAAFGDAVPLLAAATLVLVSSVGTVLVPGVRALRGEAAASATAVPSRPSATAEPVEA